MSKPTTTAATTGPYVVTIEGVESRFKTVGAAHDRISASGALILSEDRETVLERLNRGQKVPYTIAEGQTATLHDARTLTVAQQLEFYHQRQAPAPTGLENWHRRALVDMARNQPNARPEEELEALSDAELVTAAGFQPMLPALLQSELPSPVAPEDPLDFKAPGMTCTVGRYLKYMDEELEEAQAWGQVREWEAAGKFPEYTRAMRAALGEEADQAPWQWQGMQDPD